VSEAWKHPARHLVERQERAWATGGPTAVLLLAAVVRSIGLIARGRVRFARSRVGESLVMQDGERMRIFRQLRLASADGAEPGGEFRVRFTPKMSARINVLFSWLPIVLFMGLPGFVGKTWIINETSGAFGGIYLWRTQQDAQCYSHSAALRFMTKRSVPGSVSFGVYTPPSRRLATPWPPGGPPASDCEMIAQPENMIT
jgi:putative monooxygenase ydhR